MANQSDSRWLIHGGRFPMDFPSSDPFLDLRKSAEQQLEVVTENLRQSHLAGWRLAGWLDSA